MPVICDTHVHLYPGYSLEAFFSCALKNLAGCLSGAGLPGDNCARVLCLAERSDCRMFDCLQDGACSLGLLNVSPTLEKNSVCVSVGDSPVYVIAGRQLITAERLELLALGVNDAIEDGLPFVEAQRRVRRENGMAVLPWSPGKWMFARYPIVQRILQESNPDELLLGDTALRPIGWGTPRLMEAGAQRSYRVLPGTDPLPLQGEEARVGAYALHSSSAFDFERPFLSVSDALSNADGLRTVGARLSAFGVARRLLQLRFTPQVQPAPVRPD